MIKIYSSDYKGIHTFQKLEKFLVLHIKLDGLGLLNYCETQNIEYRNSKETKKCLVETIILQNESFQVNTEEIEKLKNELKSAQK